MCELIYILTSYTEQPRAKLVETKIEHPVNLRHVLIFQIPNSPLYVLHVLNYLHVTQISTIVWAYNNNNEFISLNASNTTMTLQLPKIHVQLL